MITLLEAWEHVKDRESGGKLDAIGDEGRSWGPGQMQARFLIDYWPAWCWDLFECMQFLAFKRFVAAHKGFTLRQMYELYYNPGSKAPELPNEPIEGDKTKYRGVIK